MDVSRGKWAQTLEDVTMVCPMSTKWPPHLKPDNSCVVNVVCISVFVQSIVVLTRAENDPVYSIQMLPQ